MSSSPASPSAAPRSPRPRSLVIRAGAVAGGFLAGAVGVAVVAAGGGAVGARLLEQRDDTSGTSNTAGEVLQSEIDAMVAAGVPPDDHKLRMLEDELATLQALEQTAAAPEPGINLDVVARGGQRSVAPGQPDPAEGWDHGPVECEPIPHRLSAEDIAGATCSVEPQPDGSVRYVAITPEGDRREVPFGAS